MLPAVTVTEVPVVEPTIVPLPVIVQLIDGLVHVPLTVTVWTLLVDPGHTGSVGPETSQVGH